MNYDVITRTEKKTTRLRPYIHEKDFDFIRNWINGERIHFLWCAGRTTYPPEEDAFRRLLIQEKNENEGFAFTAVTDEGRAVGFFVYSVDYMANSGFLKYIIVDPDLRGQGYGTQMMALILKYAFDISGVVSVSLNVFDTNENARRCYRKAGFREEAKETDAFSYQNELWGRCRMTVRPK